METALKELTDFMEQVDFFVVYFELVLIFGNHFIIKINVNYYI